MDIFAKGTTFIIGPVAQIVLLHKLLGATPNKYGGFTFDCNQVQNLPCKASFFAITLRDFKNIYCYNIILH